MLLRTNALSKHYGDFVALDKVDFSLRAGEVHVLFGENGAGKSTLISILAGANNATAGTVELHGKPYRASTVRQARAAGVSAVFQEFSLAPTLCVAANIFLGDEPLKGLFVDTHQMHNRAKKLLDELGFELDTRAVVSGLSRAHQQMVEIAKACREQPEVLILDEPTASLSDREVDCLFDFIGRMASKGVGIIYISHRIQEFRRISQRVTVLRDGCLIDCFEIKDTDDQALVSCMAGRAIDQLYPQIDSRPGETALSVSGLSCWGVDNVDLSVARGEVLGIAGLVGSGKSRAFRAMMGLLQQRSGTVSLGDVDLSRATTRNMLAAGAVYVPADRKAEGLQLSFSADKNLEQAALQHPDGHRRGWLNRPWLAAFCAAVAERVELAESYRQRLVVQLSGGNQQKVMFARALAVERSLYIFDEPTVGVDVGARAALYRVIKALAESGAAVVLISSDLPEVINLSQRVLVFANGRISAELRGDEISEARVLANFFMETK